VNDLEITTLIKNLSRPHPSGGVVIERAAILAAGGGSPEIIDWIMNHSGTAETPTVRSRGLHGARVTGSGENPASANPSRFVLPADALH
jgi:hypothetical protein